MFSAAQRMGLVVREVEDRDFKGEPARVVMATRTYRAEPDEVWGALTDAERIPRWFAPVTGDLKLGGRYQIEGNAGGTITECEPPHLLGLSWEFGGQTSWVVVRLTEEGAETRLTLEHIAHRTTDFLKFWDEYGPGAVGVGWDLALLALAEHLATGVALDRESGMAWPTTEEGRAFVKSTLDGWAQATVQAGMNDAASAAAAGAKCLAFYTTVPAD